MELLSSNLQSIYLVAEIIAAFAVIASLLFVGIQMRQNTNALRIAAGQGLVASWSATNRDIIANKDMAELLSPLLDGTKDMPEGADRLRLLLWAQNVIREGEMNYYNWVDGNLADHQWEQLKANTVWLMSAPAGRAIWAELRHHYSARFQAEIDGVIEVVVAQQTTGPNDGDS